MTEINGQEPDHLKLMDCAKVLRCSPDSVLKRMAKMYSQLKTCTDILDEEAAKRP